MVGKNIYNQLQLQFLYYYLFQFIMLHFPNKARIHCSTFRKLQKLGLLRWEDSKDHLLPQDFADMLGWKKLVFKSG